MCTVEVSCLLFFLPSYVMSRTYGRDTYMSTLSPLLHTRELSMGWLTHGLGWVGSHKMDPWTTQQLTVRSQDSVSPCVVDTRHGTRYQRQMQPACLSSDTFVNRPSVTPWSDIIAAEAGVSTPRHPRLNRATMSQRASVARHHGTDCQWRRQAVNTDWSLQELRCPEL